MSKTLRLQAKFVNADRPDWRPILAMLGPELTGWFSWMEEVELSDGAHAHTYRHRSTRRALHIAVDGRAFFDGWDGTAATADSCDFVEIPRTRAIDTVFRGARRGLPAEESRELKALIDAAWDVAKADGRFEIDPRELELQAKFEARQDEAA